MSGAGIGYRLPTKEDSSLPVEERFGEVFKAAKVLLEQSARENEVIPTLALANLVGQGVPRLLVQKEQFMKIGEDKRTWDDEADRFARRYGGLRPVRLAGGVLILERLPVFIGIDYANVAKTPEAVAISVYPHRTLAEPEDVASLYDKRLSDAGIRREEQWAANLSFDFHDRSLVIRVCPGTVVKRTTVTEGFTVPRPSWRRDKAAFPHPRIVQDFYSMLRRRFARELATRTRGPAPDTANLVPACVGFLLSKYGIEGRKEIHRLLNEHVLYETRKVLPLGYSNSKTEQLWRGIDNTSTVGEPLIGASWTLFWEGHE